MKTPTRQEVLSALVQMKQPMAELHKAPLSFDGMSPKIVEKVKKRLADVVTRETIVVRPAMYKNERLVRGFETAGENLVVEISLSNVSLEFLQALFNIEYNDPMYDCYPIGKKQAKALEPFLGAPLDLEHLDYFLECDAVDRDSK